MLKKIVSRDFDVHFFYFIGIDEVQSRAVSDLFLNLLVFSYLIGVNKAFNK
jgi:hypothetical protein